VQGQEIAMRLCRRSLHVVAVSLAVAAICTFAVPAAADSQSSNSSNGRCTRSESYTVDNDRSGRTVIRRFDSWQERQEDWVRERRFRRDEQRGQRRPWENRQGNNNNDDDDGDD